MTVLRKYKNKDVDMLITAGTIIENAISNKIFLQSKRATWADPFFDNNKARIDAAMQNFLGVDSAKEMRQATIMLHSVQENAIITLAEIKVQIMEDFKDDKPRRNELLKQLGFTSYLPATQKKDQEALINLLFQFKTNLTVPLRMEIITAGTAAASLDQVSGYADTLKNANITQETFKGSKRTLTAAAVNEFNSIYSAVIGIAKIAAKFAKADQAFKDQFNFSKIAKALNLKPGKPKGDEGTK